MKGNLIFNEEDLRECGIDVTEAGPCRRDFGGAGAQSIKGAHGTLLLIGLCSLLICVIEMDASVLIQQQMP